MDSSWPALQIQCNPNQNSSKLFCGCCKLIPKFSQRDKIPRIANSILKKKNKVKWLILPNFKHYYKALVMKTEWHQWKHRQTDQWSRAKSLETDPQTYDWFIFDKGSKNIQWRKDSLFFSRGCWDSITAACKSIKSEHSLTPYTRMNSKWIKDLNVRNCKALRGKDRQYTLCHKSQWDPLWSTS